MSTTWFLCLDILYVNCKNLIAFTLNVTGSVSTIIFRLVLGQCACRPQYWVFGTVCLQAQVLGFWDSVPASTTTGVLGQCAYKHKSWGFGTAYLQAPVLGFAPTECLFFRDEITVRFMLYIKCCSFLDCFLGPRNTREGLKKYKGRVGEI